MNESKISTLSIWAYLGPAILLALAPVFHWQYGYYQLLRLVIFVAAALLARLFWNHYPKKNWVIGFVVIAVIFNPVIPLYFYQQGWGLACYGAAAFFIGALVRTQPDFLVKLKKALNKLKTGW